MDLDLIDPTTPARVEAATRRFLDDADTEAAASVWREALIGAVVGGDLELEASCLLRLAAVHHQTGEFTEARLLLDRAAGVLRDLGPTARELPTHHAWRGVLDALAGDSGSATGWFDLAAATAGGTDRALATEAVLAPWLAFVAPDRLPRRPTLLAAALRDAGEDRLVVWAMRAEVTLGLVEGRIADAVALGHAVAEEEPNPAERSRILCTTGWGELWCGRAEAAAVTFAEAAASADAVGARFLRSLARFGQAEADPTRAAALLLDAISDAGSGPAWARLWEDRPPVEVSVIGTRRLCVGGVPVRFRSDRAAELLFCVILAGPAGIHWADLAALVWPDATDPARAASSVTTHTTKARRELGTEGWRLRRDGPTLWFEPTNLSVDLDRVLAAGGEVPPHTVVLPDWRDRPWVSEVLHRRHAARGSRRAS